MVETTNVLLNFSFDWTFSVKIFQPIFISFLFIVEINILYNFWLVVQTFSSCSLSRRWISLTTVSFCFSECSGSSRISLLHSSIACFNCSTSDATNEPCANIHILQCFKKIGWSTLSETITLWEVSMLEGIVYPKM